MLPHVRFVRGDFCLGAAITALLVFHHRCVKGFLTPENCPGIPGGPGGPGGPGMLIAVI